MPPEPSRDLIVNVPIVRPTSETSLAPEGPASLKAGVLRKPDACEACASSDSTSCWRSASPSHAPATYRERSLSGIANAASSRLWTCCQRSGVMELPPFYGSAGAKLSGASCLLVVGEPERARDRPGRPGANEMVVHAGGGHDAPRG